MPHNKTQLITYADSLGGSLKNLEQVLKTHFSDVFQGGVHILPPFPSSGDRGFAPLNYFEIEPSFGDWQDIESIGNDFDVVLDQMVNHISRQSSYFQDFVKKGRSSDYADLFITLDKIWPDGQPKDQDVAKIFLRKPEHPFSDILIEETQEIERIWTSFGPRVDWSEQIDLDVNSQATKDFIVSIFEHFKAKNVKMIRLDAIGYVTKKAGTSCFFVEPDIYEFLSWVKAEADKLELELLPEIHAHHSINKKLTAQGYWTYDFVLPGLILHTLYTKNVAKLQDYLKDCPKNQFTMLDCHDGIPVQPDLEDVLTIEESKYIVDVCMQRGANLNRILAKGDEHIEFDAHQINITYYDALGRDDNLYLMARAIQLFTPGIPQVYYVGLLAGENDYEALKEQDEARAVNRHNYSVAEVEEALTRPVVQGLLELIRLRNTHEAFNGDFRVEAAHEIGDDVPVGLVMIWEKGDKKCSLAVHLLEERYSIQST